MPITAHIVPHTHIDPGWLRTYTQYYGVEVKPILNAVLRELQADPARTFVWCEVCYFAQWFRELDAKGRELVRGLVASGRIEFVGGGWVQHDEGLTTIAGMLDNMAEGHLYLHETFGVWPTVGWQLDPFGHSAASAALLGRTGMQQLVINRVHFRVKKRWANERHLEFRWSGVPQLGAPPVLTHLLMNHYSTPKGFDFESSPRPAVNRNPDRRQLERLEHDGERLRKLVLSRSESYRTKQVMILVGDDFRWRRAKEQYEGWEYMMHAMGNGSGRHRVPVVAKFSTPSRYFAAVAESRPTLPAFSGDLQPYADNDNSYWVGFYATRPSLKRMARAAGSALHTAQTMFTLARASSVAALARRRGGGGGDVSVPGGSRFATLFSSLAECRRTVSVVQHHDAITGTSRPRVVEDYLKMMRESVALAHRISADAIAALLEEGAEARAERRGEGGKEGEARRHPSLTVVSHSANVSVGGGREEVRPLVVANAAPFRRCEPVWFRLWRQAGTTYRIRAADGSQPVLGVVAPATDGDGTVPASFVACVPALGVTTFYLSAGGGGRAGGEVRRWKGSEAGDEVTTLRGGGVSAELSAATGMLRGLSGGRGEIKVRAKLMAYPTQRSGAYIMRTSGPAAPLGPGPCPAPGKGGGEDSSCGSKGPQLQLHRTPAFEQLRVDQPGTFPYDVTTRVYADGGGIGGGDTVGGASLRGRSAPLVEMDISLKAPRNREVILRLTPGLKASTTVLLTHDGFAWRRRGPTPGVAERAPPESSFVPTPVGATLLESGGAAARQLTVLVDRSVGVAWFPDGSFEILLHRSLMQDDGRGVSAAAIDDSPGRLTLWFTWGEPSAAMARMSQRIMLSAQVPLLLLTPPCADGSCASAAAHREQLAEGFSGVREEATWPMMIWPRPMDNHSSRVLIRLQRSCLAGRCGDSAPVAALKALFAPPFGLSGLVETGLSGGPLAAAPIVDANASFAAAAAADMGVAGANELREDRGRDASQNSDEAGVFVSDAALTLAHEAEAGAGIGAAEGKAKGAARAAPRRRHLFGGATAAPATAAGATAAAGELEAMEARAFACRMLGDVATRRASREGVGDERSAPAATAPSATAGRSAVDDAGAVGRVDAARSRAWLEPRGGSNSMLRQQRSDAALGAPHALLLPSTAGFVLLAGLLAVWSVARRRRKPPPTSAMRADPATPAVASCGTPASGRRAARAVAGSVHYQ